MRALAHIGAAQPASSSSVAARAESDADLVERLRRGDRVALGALYDRHAPALLGTAIKMLGAEREAQDLLHDVFIEAWEHAREYDGTRGSVRTWLLVRLRSRALDRLGRAESRLGRSLDDLDADGRDVVTRRTTPPLSVDSLAIRQALERLDDSTRDALTLTYFQGFSAREIGEHLNIPVGTVKSRIARGLACLEAAMNVEGGADAE